ncbi:MAG: hypothetical protein J0H42_25795 [Rhizobiales bacterium]|nr:hypothetical protein [Hyphomicrobiales bacterium]
MQVNLLVALAVGALVSTGLLVLERVTDHSLAVMAWEMPGISAAYLFWGAIGGPAFMGIAIAWLINAVVYGVGAFAVLNCFKLLTPALPK